MGWTGTDCPLIFRFAVPITMRNFRMDFILRGAGGGSITHSLARSMVLGRAAVCAHCGVSFRTCLFGLWRDAPV